MPDGSMHGDHKGMMMTKDGSEMATDIVKGVGHRLDGGKLSFRGAAFTTTSSKGKRAFLNNMVWVFEYEQDESGNRDKTMGMEIAITFNSKYQGK